MMRDAPMRRDAIATTRTASPGSRRTAPAASSSCGPGITERHGPARRQPEHPRQPDVGSTSRPPPARWRPWASLGGVGLTHFASIWPTRHGRARPPRRSAPAGHRQPWSRLWCAGRARAERQALDGGPRRLLVRPRPGHVREMAARRHPTRPGQLDRQHLHEVHRHPLRVRQYAGVPSSEMLAGAARARGRTRASTSSTRTCRRCSESTALARTNGTSCAPCRISPVSEGRAYLTPKDAHARRPGRGGRLAARPRT